MNAQLPQRATELEPLLDQVFDQYVPASYHTASPGFMAYIPGGGIPDAGIANLIGNITNRYVTVWEGSPCMARMESIVVQWFCKMFGLPASAGGILTTGGSIANLSAIITARVKLAGEDFQKSTVYVSEDAHHCIDKSMLMAGFPRANLRKIATDRHQCLDIEKLKRKIDVDQADGFRPLMVVASAGTTGTGAIDDMPAMRKIADDHGLWFHVDAAYGGFFVLTETGKKLMSGIEAADSIVVDPHKGLFLPYGTGCLMVRERDDLLGPFQFTSSYMPDMTGDPTREDFTEISPELSREGRGLRLWLPLKLHGLETFTRLLQEKLDLTQWAYHTLLGLKEQLVTMNHLGRLEILQPPALTVLAFRLAVSDLERDEANQLNREWLNQINKDGCCMLTGTTVEGWFVLRICVLNFRTHLKHLESTLQVVSQTLWNLAAAPER